VVRSTAPIHDPSWQVDRLDLEDIVLAYMSGAATGAPERVLEGRR
jgi:ABC-2 type transport system ATP-binding protein